MSLWVCWFFLLPFSLCVVPSTSLSLIPVLFNFRVSVCFLLILSTSFRKIPCEIAFLHFHLWATGCTYLWLLTQSLCPTPLIEASSGTAPVFCFLLCVDNALCLFMSHHCWTLKILNDSRYRLGDSTSSQGAFCYCGGYARLAFPVLIWWTCLSVLCVVTEVSSWFVY